MQQLTAFDVAVIRADVTNRNYFLADGGNLSVSGGANFGAGVNALSSLTTASHNVAIGDHAASSHQDGTGSVWIGSAAGQYSVSCIDCTHVGYEAGQLQVSGVGDTGIGRRSIGKAQFAANNTCLGDSTGWSMNPQLINPSNPSLGFSQGFGNVYIGYVCSELNETGHENVVIGGGANCKATSGSQNVILGSQAMITNTGAGGDGNVAIGYSACRDYAQADATVVGAFGFFQATGIRNTGVGASVGSTVITGERNCFFGWGAGSGGETPTDVSNAIAIGYNVQPTADNQVVIGNEDNDTFVLGGVAITTAQLQALLALVS
ncbi:MAG: hypothetical protein ACTHM0_08150 [Sphingomonas sp.]